MKISRFAALSGLLAIPAAADPPAIRLQEVTVTATSDAITEQREAVSQKTVIERAEIEALGGLTVGEVIRKLPGIDAGEHGADGGMSARARGMSRDAVQFLVNGERPTANARFALTQVGRMPAGELERIEILRGGSAEFGGAAPVTVNLIMKKPVARDSTSLKLSAGQRGAEANGQATLTRGGGSQGFSWIVPVTVNHHGMPVDRIVWRDPMQALPDRETERGDYSINEFILVPRLSWKHGSDSVTLWPSYYRNDGKRATDLLRSTGDVREDREDSGTRIQRLRVEGETRAGESKISGWAAIMQGRRFGDRDRVAHDPQGVPTVWHEADRREDRELSGALRLDRASDAHLLSAGIDAARHRRDDRQRFSGALNATDDFSGSEKQFSVWLQDEWMLRPDLTTTLGLRAEHMEIDTDGSRRRHRAADPALALRWEPASGWIARTSISGAIGFPKLEELTVVATRATSANTPLEPDRGGNPALKPERSTNLEAGLERHLAGGVLGANLYRRHTRNFVERYAVLEGMRWVERPANMGKARHWGLELSAKLNQAAFLPKGDNLRVQFTLPRGEVDDERLGWTRAVRELPRYNMSLGYEGSLPAWDSTWGFQWQRNGAVATRVPDELVTDTRARNLLDAHLVRRLDKRFHLRLALQNLLGADTRRFASAWADLEHWESIARESGTRTWLASLEGKW